MSIVDPDIVEAQVRTVVDDFDVRAHQDRHARQTRNVELVAELAREGLLPHLVVDPVLVATSGDVLMGDGGIDAYRDALFPFAEVVTPNLREAAAALRRRRPRRARPRRRRGASRDASSRLGPRYVLVKGGHLGVDPREPTAPPTCSLDRDGLVVLDGPRVATTNDHGTGCSLSAAIAAGLALGRSVPDATRDAKSFVLAALEGAATWRLGHGRGPIDHLGWGE